MLDTTIQALVRDVMQGGLASAGPLLDRLLELGDARAPRLARGLDELLMEASVPERRRRQRSPEEEAFRRDERCFRAWLRFAGGLRKLFTLELGLMPALAALAAAEKALDAPKQAARAARPPAEDDEESGASMLAAGREDGPAWADG